MYTLSVAREFEAEHYLTVPDPGPEGEPHSHRYRVEVRFSGGDLDEFGYLVDIDDVEEALEELVGRYQNALLNDLPEFAGANPSVERFARAFCDRMAERVATGTPTEIAVRLWESEDASASYERAC